MCYVYGIIAKTNMQQEQNSYYPQPQGLYNSANEHDACGVGMVADINGVKKHSIVENGVQILERLMHRGAVGGDSQTGDGAGIMTQIPDEFFRNKVPALPPAGDYAVGMIFLPRDVELAEKCRAVCEAAIADEGMSVITWRKVPVDESAIGGVALATCPRIEQVFVSGRNGRSEADFERALYILRRVIEKGVDAKVPAAGDSFYICTLSCRTIVYKGLLNAPQLKAFFPDLFDESYKSALALVHQRYSTNTFPTWQLAQPFRYLAHNGEINTLRGNLNQMRSRETHFESPLFGENISKVIPVIRENQSDSACLDNAVELYASAGRTLAHTMLMLVPQAWGKNFYVSKDIAGFFEYNSGVSEPWDGPAALAFTDGTRAGALLDRNGLRPARYTICSDGLFVLASETGEAREIAHFCLLLGYGATAINPYLAIESIANMVEDGRIKGIDAAGAVENYIKAICKGILKVMSKMGISTLRSYRQAQVFEAVGLGRELVDKYFAPTASRIGGIGLTEIASESLARYHNAHYPKPNFENVLENSGKYKFKKDGEHHLWTPQTITLLQRAVRDGDESKYRQYADFINNQAHHLCTLRGLFKFKPTKAIPLDEVEPVESIIHRFVTGAMSFGSISPEAHETIALAMNKLGGMSNCGEGGEDPARYAKIGKEGDISSAIKQVASGRFGVTAEYLANAKELQIKVAQGAKPGEGGQLPGYKVNEIIARVRHATAGVTLISPPPHHDIYSIEDLAQLIYDLRNANEQARVSVKLVSEVGVGTVAAGVAKAKADVVLISGHDGGTGASPLTSIKYAGLPWELGIAEAQQTLRLNGLRDKIRVQVDGQMKTGRDVVIGALLGAEEFGFATAILVTLGCVMMRKCHDNSCPVGVATQDPKLRKCFKGKPEHIENFLRFIANEVREILASLGLHSIDEAVGRSDLLETNEAIEFWKSKNIDFSKIFEQVGDDSLPRRSAGLAPRELKDAYDKKILAQLEANIENGEPVEISMPIKNSDRSVGAMLANHIARKYGHVGLPADTIKINFSGVAGQSFGAFLASGATFVLEGEANDYMGKSLSGGTIVVRLPRDSKLDSSSNVIAGNVIGYGATSGKVFVNGKAGERFAIRNSGATFVVEGVGDHGCEYMTGGRVVCLGPTGFNFAAGMTGGFAYVYDELGNFDMRCNLQSVDLESVVEDSADDHELRALVEDFQISTGSKRAKAILDNWENELPKFVKVFPIEYRKVLGKLVGGDEVKETIKHV